MDFTAVFTGASPKLSLKTLRGYVYDVSLSYQLPSKLLARTKFITGANITLTGNNLWLHTDYTGFDPESSSANAASNADAFSGFTYPAVRSFLATINVTF